MRLTWRDAAATALTGAVAVLYIGQTIEASWAPLTGVRSTAGAALVLGLGACVIGGAEAAKDSAVMSGPLPVIGVSTGLLLLVAVITGWAPPLALAVSIIVVLWLATTGRHLRRRPAASSVESHPEHAGHR